MPKITWSNTPRASGRLAGVCEGPRGYTVKVDGKRVGMVGHAVTWPDNKPQGWYSSVIVNGIRRNTADQEPPVFFPDKDAAKADCDRWIRETLGLPVKKENTRV